MPSGGSCHDELPVALVPAGMIGTKSIDEALAEVAHAVADAPDGLPRTAGTRPPGAPLPTHGLRLLRCRWSDRARPDTSTPSRRHCSAATPPTSQSRGRRAPGRPTSPRRRSSGWSLEHGWRVGVTSQSHKAIENVLRAVVAAGVPATQVGKATHGAADATVDHPGQGRRPRRVRGRAPRRRSRLRHRRYRVGPHEHQTRPARRARPRRHRRGRPVLAWPRRSPARWPDPDCCCSATPSSCRRSRRAPIRTPSTHPRSGGWSERNRCCAPSSATSSRPPGGCIQRSRPRCPGCRTPVDCAPRSPSPPPAPWTAWTPGCTCAWSTTTTTPRRHRRRPTPWSTWSVTCSGTSWHDPDGPTGAGRAPAAPAAGHPRHHAVQRPGGAAAPHPRRRRIRRGRRGNGRQVPGPGGPGGHPVDGGVIAHRRLARHGVPARPTPPQRRRVPRQALRLHRALRGPHRLRPADSRRAHRPRRLPRAV